MKQDFFTSNNLKFVDWKDIELLKKFLAPNARLLSRRKTNLTAKNQRKMEEAVKRARFMGLLPFIAA
ncbi:30S ribosomal protein S18 [Candidatus Nomurabacteria bacterium RIFCSPHIGHO2_02_FULL_33_12]|nr:MAG: 30S ribosomal protein S18 [Candidatus Nomurabacteria bacterium RIFCSPHIGHO2_02_FULL_33_12]